MDILIIVSDYSFNRISNTIQISNQLILHWAFASRQEYFSANVFCFNPYQNMTPYHVAKSVMPRCTMKSDNNNNMEQATSPTDTRSLKRAVLISMTATKTGEYENSYFFKER